MILSGIVRIILSYILLLEERMRQSGHWQKKEALDAEKILLFLSNAIASWIYFRPGKTYCLL